MVNSTSLSSTSSSSSEEGGEEEAVERGPPSTDVPLSPPFPVEEESEYETTPEPEEEIPVPLNLGSVTQSKEPKERGAKTVGTGHTKSHRKQEGGEGPDVEEKKQRSSASGSKDGIGDKGPPGDRQMEPRERRSQEIQIHLEAQVPERVRKALQKSGSFEEFKARRTFTFLHLFAERNLRQVQTWSSRSQRRGQQREAASQERRTHLRIPVE